MLSSNICIAKYLSLPVERGGVQVRLVPTLAGALGGSCRHLLRKRRKRGHPTARVESAMISPDYTRNLLLVHTFVACNMTLKCSTRRDRPGSGAVPRGHVLARGVGPMGQPARSRSCSGRGRVLSYQDLQAKRVQRILGHTALSLRRPI